METTLKYKTEIELMQALGIESWRNLSKDKMCRFAAMMPDTDKEVALKIVEQFPEFKSFALEALDVVEKRHESTLVHNKQSQESVHRTCQEIRAILKGELDRDDLSSDDRKGIFELIMETGKREFDKDSENKQFLEGMFKTAAVAVGGALLAGIVFVGGKAMIENSGIDEDLFRS